MLCRVMSYHVLCRVVLCRVISRVVLCCVVSYHVSCRVVSCCVMFCHFACCVVTCCVVDRVNFFNPVSYWIVYLTALVYFLLCHDVLSCAQEDSDYYSRFHQVIDSAFRLPYRPLTLEDLAKTPPGSDASYSEEPGDACMARIMGTFVEEGTGHCEYQKIEIDEES
ncbi:hypothetical protein ACOMHN_055510 [Nucella lapillus]